MELVNIEVNSPKNPDDTTWVLFTVRAKGNVMYSMKVAAPLSRLVGFEFAQYQPEGKHIFRVNCKGEFDK